MELFIEVSFEFQQLYYATLYLQSLDSKSTESYDDLDDQLQPIINPFVEPTFIHSTIDDTLGDFGSALRSDPVQFIYPQENT